MTRKQQQLNSCASERHPQYHLQADSIIGTQGPATAKERTSSHGKICEYYGDLIDMEVLDCTLS